MAEFLPQRKAAFARNEKGLAKELSLNGLAHKANMEFLDKEASANIFQAPEVGVEPLVIDPHEDHESLCFKARHQENWMAEFFRQSNAAFARNEKGLAKEPFLNGLAHKANMELLDREASAKIFQAPEVGVVPLVIDPHEDHESLRFRARSEGNLMSEYFQQATNAFARNEKGLAKELSLKGQMHKANMVRLNKEASAKIFQENNEHSKPGEVDLHGLYVKEAISYSDKALKEARQRGNSQIRLIAGKGLHSDGHVAKLEPALEGLMRQHNLPAEVDPQNSGILIVQLA
ncbi:DUF1771-domain-containing protein [Rhizopogon vinicolor AM-OR11-026]|uniref:DUF1771-domain-containing protein n=1 Tax=Rhizopogon vinicolor AM-OR11-026 TaxID=1314800 RepID=A0A1B7MMR1_9AGAM|nr:DUF1771-domain-containing protein [Rhizopogon vinicolor AM-OR11-026]